MTVTINIDAVLCSGNGQKVMRSVNISAGESIKKSVSGTGGILFAYVHLSCPNGNYCDTYTVNYGDDNNVTLKVIYDGIDYYLESE